MASRQQAIDAFVAKKYRRALNIAKNFKIGVSDAQRQQMALGYECIAHESTYVQMGYNCEEEVAKAIQILQDVLDVHEVEVPTVEETVAPIVLDADVAEVPTENSEPEFEEWLFITSKKGVDDVLFAQVIKAPNWDWVDAAMKAARAEGYHFVCIISKDKMDKFIKGQTVGMRGVYTNFEYRKVENPISFMQRAYARACEAKVSGKERESVSKVA